MMELHRRRLWPREAEAEAESAYGVVSQAIDAGLLQVWGSDPLYRATRNDEAFERDLTLRRLEGGFEGTVSLALRAIEDRMDEDRPKWELTLDARAELDRGLDTFAAGIGRLQLIVSVVGTLSLWLVGFVILMGGLGCMGLLLLGLWIYAIKYLYRGMDALTGVVVRFVVEQREGQRAYDESMLEAEDYWRRFLAHLQTATDNHLPA